MIIATRVSYRFFFLGFFFSTGENESPRADASGYSRLARLFHRSDEGKPVVAASVTSAERIGAYVHARARGRSFYSFTVLAIECGMRFVAEWNLNVVEHTEITLLNNIHPVC